MPKYRVEFDAIKPSHGVAMMEVLTANLKLYELSGEVDNIASTRVDDEPEAPAKPAPVKGKLAPASKPPPALETVEDDETRTNALETAKAKDAMMQSLGELAKRDKSQVKAILGKLKVATISEIPEDRYIAVTTTADRLTAQFDEEPPY